MSKKLVFTTEELSRYFGGRHKHKTWLETVEMAIEMTTHADGLYPQKMIEERRPSESIAVKDYRKKIWKPVTKPVVNKVITELNKIRRSSEWAIRYDQSKVSPKIAPQESLHEYCEARYPYFTSITNWVFKVLLPGYCKDANAVIAMMPINPEPALNEYYKPFGFLFNSHFVIDFVQNDYAVIKYPDKIVYDNNGVKTYGDVYYIFTTRWVQRWEQTNGTLTFALKWECIHNIGELPVFRVEGLYKKTFGDTFIFESRLAAMLPRLDEALREYSDLQAEVVQHVFSEKWEMASDECGQCKGTGEIKTAGVRGETVQCTKCGGSGAKGRSPYQTIYIKPGMAGDGTSQQTPPAGYIQKSVEIVKIQDERIEKHEYKALSAVNMEYLAETPLNESGTAKEVDKDALNNFVHPVAEDLVSVMDKMYYFICEYRYSVVLPNKEDRKALLPYIPVPEKFDLLSATFLEDQISKQKENKGNPIIISAMEEDYVNKKFAGDNYLRQRILLSIRLDPLTGINEDDKMVRLSNKGITLETYIVSCNIQDFINRALEEKGDSLFTMNIKDQKALLLSYATQQIQGNTVGGALISEFDSESAGSSGAGGLKNSVGGLTGMIEIAKAVASGLYDLDAAVALVADRFGITEDAARKQLGSPKIPDDDKKIDKVAALT